MEQERDRAVARFRDATARNALLEEELTELRGQVADAVPWRRWNERESADLREQIEEVTGARATITEELAADRERAITILTAERNAALAEQEEQLTSLRRSRLTSGADCQG